MMAVMMTPRKLPSYFATEEEQRPAPAATAPATTPERCGGLTPAARPAVAAAMVRPLRAL